MPDFELSYAGVPLLGDKGMALLHPLPYLPRGLSAKDNALTKQQPLADLLDDTDRVMPRRYLADFTEPRWQRSKRLDSLAHQWADTQLAPEEVHIGDWHYPVGAGRFSVFRGLADADMVAQILSNTGANVPATFIMAAQPLGAFIAGTYRISTSMYMLAPRPLHEHGAGNKGIFEIALVDERYWFQCTPVSLKVVPSSTWQFLINQCADALGISVTIPTIPSAYGTRPAADCQLWTDEENAAFLLDALAASIGMRVVRNFDGSYALQIASAAQALVSSNRGAATSVVRLAGGDLFNTTASNITNLAASKNAVVPAAVEVTFAKYVAGNDPVPHYINTRYSADRPTAWYEDSHGDAYNVTVPIASGGSAVSGVTGVAGFSNTIHSTAKALYATESAAFAGSPDNAADLQALAAQVAQDYYAWQVGVALDEVYPGILLWTPEGYHDLVFTYSDRAHGASTRVMTTQWNNFIRDMQHATLAGGAVTVTSGVGGHSVAQTWLDQSGTVVPGTNVVSVIGGTISGQLYSGGAQVVYLTFPTGVENAGLRSGYGTSDPVIVNSEWVSGVKNLRFDQNAFSASGWALSGNLDIYTNLKVGTIDNSVLVSGTYQIGFDGSGFILSGYTGSGQVNVYHYYGATPDIRPVGLAADAGTLGKVARADHVHPTSGAIKSGMVASGIWIYLASGVQLATINSDLTQFTNPTTLIFADNNAPGGFISGFPNGRLVFTNLTASGTPTATQIDWQGLRLYKQGVGFVGPCPDLEIIDGTNITTSISGDFVDNRVLLRIDSTAAASGSTGGGGFTTTFYQTSLAATATITTAASVLPLTIGASGTYLVTVDVDSKCSTAGTGGTVGLQAWLQNGANIINNSYMDPFFDGTMPADDVRNGSASCTIIISGIVPNDNITLYAQATDSTPNSAHFILGAGAPNGITRLSAVRIA